jgi:carboxyl-terminal processing protease
MSQGVAQEGLEHVPKMNVKHVALRALIALFLVGAPVFFAAPSNAGTAETQPSHAAVFDEAWRVTRDRFYDPGMGGLDWQAVGDKYRPLAEAATTSVEFAAVINAMLAELHASHMGYFTPDDPAYYHLADIFGGTERDDAKPFFDSDEIRYPGIGIFTREIDGDIGHRDQYQAAVEVLTQKLSQ